jgi:cyclophilin family peptidyl-prolyl cis-trans isomerase
MRHIIGIAVIGAIAVATGLGAQSQGAGRGRGAQKPALPVVVFQVDKKGSFEVEFYSNDAPKSVEHILTLVRRNFYNGLRVHRVEPDFVVQFGDPQTRDVSKKARWGSGGSGRAIGVAEISPTRPHKLGTVALAHAGDPASTADSQIYVCLNSDPGRYSYMNGKYAVIGQVISGMSVVQQIRELDVIRASVKGQAPPPTAKKP